MGGELRGFLGTYCKEFKPKWLPLSSILDSVVVYQQFCHVPLRFGPRFPAMTHPYDLSHRNLAKEVAKELGMDSFLREGV